MKYLFLLLLIGCLQNNIKPLFQVGSCVVNPVTKIQKIIRVEESSENKNTFIYALRGVDYGSYNEYETEYNLLLNNYKVVDCPKEN